MDLDINQVKKELKLRDKAVRALSKDGMFRIAAIKNTTAAQTAQNRHNLSPIQAFLLARQLSAASLIATFLKGEERVVVEAEGKGPIRRVFAEAMQLGEVRGFIEKSENYDEGSISEMSDAIGIGLYKVTRILYNENEPITGIVELIKGDISTDLAYYFTKSEQLPTAALLDVELDEDGTISHSGGLLVQAMPGASESQRKEIYGKLAAIPHITSFYQKGYDPGEMLHITLPFEFDVLKKTPVDFYCRCSKEGFMSKLLTLGADELIDMKKDGNSELVCRYCNEKYYLSDADFDSMIGELKAKEN